MIGISSVNGNRGIEITTENTLRVVDLLGKNIPVYKGCHLPLVSTLLKEDAIIFPSKAGE